MNEFVLSPEQTERILKLGLRPVDVSKQARTVPYGNVIAGYLLIPVKNSSWQHQIETTWDGSYVPLLIYGKTTWFNKTQHAAILIPYGEEDFWQRELADKLTEILGLSVRAQGD